jgi:recombination DNA repair RAD52 pathway protein
MDELQDQLSRPPTQTRKRPVPGGRTASYLTIQDTLANASEVFGVNYSILIVRPPIVVTDHSSGRKILECTVEVQLPCGTRRQAIGVASYDNSATVEEVMNARKTCESNATKRALKTFGAYLGGGRSDAPEPVKKRYQPSSTVQDAELEHLVKMGYIK